MTFLIAKIHFLCQQSWKIALLAKKGNKYIKKSDFRVVA